MKSYFAQKIENTILFIVTILICFIFLEFGLRFFLGVPIGENKDWRSIHVQL